VESANAVLSNPELLDRGIAERRHFDSGEAIIVEGAEDRCVYLLETGVARVSERVRLDGEKHIQPGLCDLQPGDIFGELSLFEGGPRSASVMAVEPCRVLVFDGEKLSDHFDAHPDQGYLVLKGLFAVLNQRLRQADKRLGSLLAWGLKAHGIDEHL
jgi:CRP-like cAMP-binding protein